MLAPIILLCLIYTVIGIFPFGDKTLFTNDMTYEYMSFFTLYKQLFRGEVSFFYTFSKVIGGDMAGFLGYYLLSPFNILSLFFQENQIPILVLLITLLKIGTSGFTMNLYLNRQGNQKASIFFSTAYALMAYNIAYQQNIMWLDGVIFLPLVVRGIERVIEEQKCLLYILSLGVALISNYYTGYMLCLFSVIYFLVYLLSERASIMNIWKSAIIPYTWASLLAGGIAAITLLPIALSLQGGKSEFLIKNLLDISIKYSPLEILSYLLPGKFEIEGGTFGSPYIYCGIFIIFFCFIFLINKNIKWQVKFGNILIFFILLISISVACFDRIWHGTELPTGYPHRYSFLVSFVLIKIAYEGFKSWKWIESGGAKRKKSVYLILLLVSCFELTFNSVVILKSFGYVPIVEFRTAVDKLMPYIVQIKERDTSFYRMETLTCVMGMNSPAFYGYRGLSSSSSGEEVNTKKLAGNLGLNEKDTWIAYHKQMSVGMESLLGLKYIFLEGNEKDFYKDISNGASFYIYQNPYALSVGMLTDASILQANIDNIDMFAIQNEIWNSVLRTAEPLYRNIPAEELYREDDGVTYEFVVDSEDSIYTNFQSEGAVETCNILVNGEKQNFFYPEKQSFNLGEFQIGDVVRVEIRTSRMNINWYDLFFYYEDMDVLENNITRILNDGFQIEEFRENFFRGTAANWSDEERYMLFTIPYDNGWKIWIDGNMVEAEKALDCLICLRVPKGEHEVVLKFVPPGLSTGIIISIISILLIIIFTNWKLFLRRKD